MAPVCKRSFGRLACSLLLSSEEISTDPLRPCDHQRYTCHACVRTGIPYQVIALVLHRRAITLQWCCL
jgi:hypothetical protein